MSVKDCHGRQVVQQDDNRIHKNLNDLIQFGGVGAVHSSLVKCSHPCHLHNAAAPEN